MHPTDQTKFWEQQRERTTNRAPLFCCEGIETVHEIRKGRRWVLLFWLVIGFVVVAAIASI